MRRCLRYPLQLGSNHSVAPPQGGDVSFAASGTRVRYQVPDRSTLSQVTTATPPCGHSVVSSQRTPEVRSSHQKASLPICTKLLEDGTKRSPVIRFKRSSRSQLPIALWGRSSWELSSCTAAAAKNFLSTIDVCWMQLQERIGSHLQRWRKFTLWSHLARRR